MTNHWTKAEEEIMINNYEKTSFEEISDLLPKKSRQQIFNKANKLGLKRNKSITPEKIYYDNEEKAWVRETETETAKVREIHPSPEGQSYEVTKDKFVKKLAKVIYDSSDKYYYDFLSENNLPHHPKFREIYGKVSICNFIGESTDHLVKEINDVIMEINSKVDKNGNQKDEKKRQIKPTELKK